MYVKQTRIDEGQKMTQNGTNSRGCMIEDSIKLSLDSVDLAFECVDTISGQGGHYFVLAPCINVDSFQRHFDKSARPRFIPCASPYVQLWAYLQTALSRTRKISMLLVVNLLGSVRDYPNTRGGRCRILGTRRRSKVSLTSLGLAVWVHFVGKESHKDA